MRTISLTLSIKQSYSIQVIFEYLICYTLLMHDKTEEFKLPSYEMPVNVNVEVGDRVVVQRSSGDLDVFTVNRVIKTPEGSMTKDKVIGAEITKMVEKGKRMQKQALTEDLAELNRPVRTAKEWQEFLDHLVNSGGTKQLLSYGPGTVNESWTNETPVMIGVVLNELSQHAQPQIRANDVTWEALIAIKDLQPKIEYSQESIDRGPRNQKMILH
jgi:hypothetical protein